MSGGMFQIPASVSARWSRVEQGGLLSQDIRTGITQPQPRGDASETAQTRAGTSDRLRRARQGRNASRRSGWYERAPAVEHTWHGRSRRSACSSFLFSEEPDVLSEGQIAGGDVTANRPVHSLHEHVIVRCNRRIAENGESEAARILALSMQSRAVAIGLSSTR